MERRAISCLALFAGGALSACNPPIVENQAPGFDLVEPPADSILKEGEVQNFVVNLYDRDRDPLHFELAIGEDVFAATDGANLDQLTLPLDPVPANVTSVTATITDGIDAVTRDFSFGMNLRPSMPKIEVTPLEPNTLEDIVASITQPSVDPDDSTMFPTWLWTSEDSQETVEVDGDQSTLTADKTEKGQTWQVTLTVQEGTLEDGVDPDGIVLTTSILRTIQNTPPEAPVISVSPAHPTPAHDLDLQCTVDTDSVDVDNDFVSYSFAWLKDGDPTGVSGATFPAEDLDSGTWSCVVTPADSDADGATTTSQVVIPERVGEVADAPVVITGSLDTAFGSSALGFPLLNDAPVGARDLVVAAPDYLSLDAGLIAVFDVAALEPDASLASRTGGLLGQNWAGLGGFLTSGGDIFIDGQPELLTTGTSAGQGVVFIIPGESLSAGSDATFSYGATLLGPRADFGFGAASGDVDDDGISDVFVSGSTGDVGQVFLFSGASIASVPGGALGDGQANARIDGGPGFGAALAVADFDGDGKADLVASSDSPADDKFAWFIAGDGLSTAGIVDLADVEDGTLAHPTETEPGRSLAVIPDLDGNGIDDLAIGVPAETSSGGSVVGAVYIIDGSALAGTVALETTARVRILGVAAAGGFGEAIRILGDLGTDGAYEIGVAAPDAGSENNGIVYLFSGEFLAADGELDAADDALYSITGAAGDHVSVGSPLGDLDLDGAVDFAVITPTYGTPDLGGVYLFLTGE